MRARGGPSRSGHRITVAAIRGLSEAGEGTGAQVVERLPWLAALEPAVLLRASVEAFRDRGGWHRGSLRLSESSRAIVEAAYGDLERFDGRGSGAAAIVDLAQGGWRQHRFAGRQGELEAPRTAGALAKPLRQRARLARLADRHRETWAAAA